MLWGLDNRTCAFRVVGHGSSVRVECRIPGGDVNPYLAVAALVAAGLRGVEESLPLAPAFEGNAYVADAPRVPTTLREACELFANSAVARQAFGDEVVDHYTHAANVGSRRLQHRRHRLGTLPRIRTSMSTTQGIINPATEREIATVAVHDLDETNRAIDRASEAAPSWRNVTPADRARLLRRFADVVDAHIEELAQLEVANSGHTISNARWEAGNVRDVLLYYSGAPERHSGRQIPVAGGVDITFYEPLGVVGIIVPWNFPMPIAGWGLAPALAAGNTVVMKPATLTPLTALRLGELALDAGIPEGVFQVVTGDGSMVGNRFVTHPSIRKVCFTGSNAVGRLIMQGCAEQVKRVTFELGGKSANIIFDDADLEKAAANAPYAVFDNAGQDCCARSRLLVQASAYERFIELFETGGEGRQGPRPHE